MYDGKRRILKPAKPRPARISPPPSYRCLCGCGSVTLRPNSFLRGHYWNGRFRSEADKGKIRRSKVGQFASEESRKKMSNSSRVTHLKGKRGADHPKKGREVSAETRGRLSRSLKAYWSTVRGLQQQQQEQLEKMLSD